MLSLLTGVVTVDRSADLVIASQAASEGFGALMGEQNLLIAAGAAHDAAALTAVVTPLRTGEKGSEDLIQSARISKFNSQLCIPIALRK